MTMVRSRVLYRCQDTLRHADAFRKTTLEMRVNRVHDLRHSYATIQLYEHHAPSSSVGAVGAYEHEDHGRHLWTYPRQGTRIALADRLDHADATTLR